MVHAALGTCTPMAMVQPLQLWVLLFSTADWHAVPASKSSAISLVEDTVRSGVTQMLDPSLLQEPTCALLTMLEQLTAGATLHAPILTWLIHPSPNWRKKLQASFLFDTAGKTRPDFSTQGLLIRHSINMYQVRLQELINASTKPYSLFSTRSPRSGHVFNVFTVVQLLPSSEQPLQIMRLVFPNSLSKQCRNMKRLTCILILIFVRDRGNGKTTHFESDLSG